MSTIIALVGCAGLVLCMSKMIRDYNRWSDEYQKWEQRKRGEE